MPHEITLMEATKRAIQAELICRMMESHPQSITDYEVSAIASLLRHLTGDVFCWLNDELASRENSDA